MQDREKFAQWIQPQHLEESFIKSLRELSHEDFSRGVVLDNFLKPEMIARLYKAVSLEAEYDERYQLYSEDGEATGPSVDEKEFLSVPEELRFLTLSTMTEVKPEHRMSPNWITYLKYRDFQIRIFPRFLESISEYALSTKRFTTHAHSYRHFLKRHRDDGNGIRFCSILYLTPDWKPECGGALVIAHDSGEEAIVDALYNRLVLFSPTSHTYHLVTRHMELARDMTRYCHVAWFWDAREPIMDFSGFSSKEGK